MRGRGVGVRFGLWVVFATAGCVGSAPAVPTVRMDPLRVPAPGAGALAPVAFMAGCWRSVPGAPTVLEERWSPPEGGVMLGTSRYFREGRAVSFEFGLIRRTGDEIVFLPHPGGTASEHAFVLTVAEPGVVIFEAPEHDFPKRIHYRRTEAGITARADGGIDDPEPRIWILEAVACD